MTVIIFFGIAYGVVCLSLVITYKIFGIVWKKMDCTFVVILCPKLKSIICFARLEIWNFYSLLMKSSELPNGTTNY
jgi:hypothetical protein